MASGDRQGGYSFVLLLFLLATVGLALAGMGEVWHRTALRQKSNELEFIGRQFVQAIDSYRRFSPDGTPAYPQTLEALLADTRNGAIRRHLRRIYVDPYSGRAEWGLVTNGQGIVGIYSLAPAAGGAAGEKLRRFVVSGVQ